MKRSLSFNSSDDDSDSKSDKKQKVDIKRGMVYIASMNLRGTWAPMPHKKAIRLNVTSAQKKSNMERLQLSPMTPIEGGYKGYWNFESYWQSGKKFEGINHKQSILWWKKQKKAKRRYPGSRNIKVLYSCWSSNEEEKNNEMDYITSRKLVYVPEYYELIKNRDVIKKWNRVLDQGHDVVIYDFDGPRHPVTRTPVCLQVDKDLLVAKLNDPIHPFGHGYVVASLLLGLKPEDFM